MISPAPIKYFHHLGEISMKIGDLLTEFLKTQFTNKIPRKSSPAKQLQSHDSHDSPAM